MAESLRKVLTPLRAVNDETLNRENTSTTGSGGDGLGPRIANVEHIKASLHDVKTELRDFKKQSRVEFLLIFGAIITTTLGIAGIIAKGFHWL